MLETGTGARDAQQAGHTSTSALPIQHIRAGALATGCWERTTVLGEELETVAVVGKVTGCCHHAPIVQVTCGHTTKEHCRGCGQTTVSNASTLRS